MSTDNNSRLERRRDEKKRQIMGALKQENNDDSTSSTSSSLYKPAELLVQSLDGSNADQVKLLIQDLRTKVQRQQAALQAEAATGKQEQLGSHFGAMLQLSTKIKHMTVREFNQQYKCDLLQIVTSHAAAGGNKKRIRPVPSKTDLETPAPTKLSSKAQATPSRTVKRGEALFSKNGSPLDHVDEGTLVATVAKKRRAGGSKTSAVFDINVGEGRYINLMERGTVECLDGDMKDAAISQLKILQNQMADLMAQLNN